MSPTLRELEAVCQKPNWREVGNWLDRRVTRPLALYVTWLLVRGPVSANLVTATTFAVGCAAVVLLAMPSAVSFVAGALVLQLWYLLDQVDGQVARYRRTASVTGIYFDFMMHHLVHPACAFALGYGVAARTGELAWTLAGAGFALGLVALAVSDDCRYKAFFCVLLRVPGRRRLRTLTRSASEGGNSTSSRLRVGFVWDSLCRCSGGGAQLALGLPLRLLAVLHFLGRKACEMPHIVVAVGALAVLFVVRPAAGLCATQAYVLFMSLLAPALGTARFVKQILRRVPDVEFQELIDRDSCD